MKTQTIDNPMRLREMVEAVQYAMCTDSTRYNLNSIHFECDSEGIMAVATDGHRLAVRHSKTNGIDLPKQGVTIEAVGIKALRKTLNKKRRGLPAAAGLALTSKTLELVIPGRPAASMPLLDSDYPAWRQVVPKAGPTIALDATEKKRGELIEVMEAFQDVNPIKVTIEGTTLKLETTKPVAGGEIRGTADFQCAGTLDGKCEPFRVNGGYFADALRAMQGGTTFQPPTDKHDPMKFSDQHGNIAVVIPTRL